MTEGGDTTAFPAESLALLKKSAPDDIIARLLPKQGVMKRLIVQSGVPITQFRLICLSVMTAAVGFALMFAVSRNLVASLAALAAGMIIPFSYLTCHKVQRKSRFEEQFPDVLTMLARSLRAGHALTSAIELVGQEMPDPSGGLFRTVYDMQKLGMRVNDSLRTLEDKIESVDLGYFITIVRINHETGGNLAEILDKLAETVRSRLQIRRQVKVYSAQGRMSGYVISALPVVVFIAFNILNPEYMKVFFTERSAQFTLAFACISQITGLFVILKIVTIRI